MAGLETLLGWLYSHSFTLLYGMIIGIVFASVLMQTGVSKMTQPFFGELKIAASAYREIMVKGSIKEYQVYLGLVAIAFAIFGGFVISAILALVGHLSTPHG